MPHELICCVSRIAFDDREIVPVNDHLSVSPFAGICSPDPIVNAHYNPHTSKTDVMDIKLLLRIIGVVLNASGGMDGCDSCRS